MRHLQLLTLVALVVASVVFVGEFARQVSAVDPGTTELVSVASDGTPGNEGGWHATISGDGRFVAFVSESSNLVTGDTNGESDVFVRDRQAGTTELVSVASDGGLGNRGSYFPNISGDGRYVTFVSDASNLVTGDTNGERDVFVRDRQTGTTELVSVASDGTQGNSSVDEPVINWDGRFVAYSSDSTNLVTGDTNGLGDVFVRDRQAGTTELVSVAQGNRHSWSAHISNDGRFVAFSSYPPIYPGSPGQVFVRDRQAGTTELVSVASDGTPGNDYSGYNAISGDGRFVTFNSDASNLVTGDTNGRWDVFVRDRQAGTTELVSVAPDGSRTSGGGNPINISRDGRYVAFQEHDLFMHDRQAGTTELVSVAYDGSPANSISLYSSISDDGRFVAFESWASNLVSPPAIFGGVFVRDRCPDGSCGTTPPTASCPSVQLETTVTVSLAESSRWANVQRYHDDCILPAFLVPSEGSPYPYPIRGSIGIRAFGTDQPPYQEFLLWRARRNTPVLASTTPVLLVHGVCSNVEDLWNNMTDKLINEGYKVYAVQFSIPCGSIEPKAEALADAVDLVRAESGSQSVDVVAHSMGGLVTRYFMQGLIDIPASPSNPAEKAYPYQGQIRNFIMIATPNGGFDQIYRHPLADSVGVFFGGAQPSPWSNDGTFGGRPWISVASGKYDGILEMTRPQANKIKTHKSETEWMNAAYFGTPAAITDGSGQTFYAFADGIVTPTRLGGWFIDRLGDTALPQGSNYAIFAGEKNCIYPLYPLLVRCTPSMEKPSDGIVFVNSAFDFAAPNVSCFKVDGNHQHMPSMNGVMRQTVRFLRDHNRPVADGAPVIRCDP